MSSFSGYDKVLNVHVFLLFISELLLFLVVAGIEKLAFFCYIIIMRLSIFNEKLFNGSIWRFIFLHGRDVFYAMMMVAFSI